MAQTDPRIERLLADQDARERAEQDTRNAEQRSGALVALAEHDAEVTRRLPAEELAVAELREIAERARTEYIARAATLENWANGRPIRRSGIVDVLMRTMPRPWRDARAELEARIVAECGRDIPREARAIHAEHVSGLQTARDRLDALVECPVEALAGRIAVILAEIPPRYEGQTVPVKSWMQQQAEGLRAYLANRFTEGNAA